jgi:hypothetical protein
MAFSAQILINSVDYYAQLTGEISVSIDEGAARLATFTLDPLPGPIDPYAWIGQPVEIYYDDGTGAALIFTGIVHTPDYDIDAGTTQFTCTDGLQEAFETLTRAQADQLIPAGVWSDKIFRSTRDNWDYAQQKMSTYPGSLDKSPAGALRVTDWTAKSTPDYTYTAANIDSGTLKIDQLAERRSIINSVKITYSSLFQALRQREQVISWAADGVTPWGLYLSNPFPLPERQAIEAALDDWTLKQISYTDLPDSGTYNYLGQDQGWVLNDYGETLCQGFTATVAARWRQDVVAEYTITVGNAASQSQHGLLEIEQRYNVSHKTKGRGEDFLKFDTYKSPAGELVYDSGAFGTAFEWLQSTQGDDGLPQMVAVSIARTKILHSHRQNRISFECALNPGLDVSKTVAIDHPKLAAKGKVYRIEHRINVLEGFAITLCTIAITLPSVDGQTSDSIARAAMPYATPIDFAPPSAPASFAALGQYVGNDNTSAEEDQSWTGWVTNYPFWSGTGDPPPYYDPPRFAVETPAIDASDYNAWLNDETELQTRLVKSGGNYYQRVLFGSETVIAGDEVMLYDVDTLQDTHTVTTSDLDAGYYQIAAIDSRQDEHSITHMITAAYNVALPVDTLEIAK